MPTNPIDQAAEGPLSESTYAELLSWLNQQGGHRYTGLFMYTPEGMRSAYLYDRDQPQSLRWDSLIPVDASYCSFVCESKRTFLVVDAQLDPRTKAHPSRDAVRSYCGVPIYQEDGSLWGTLCYFGPDAKAVSPAQIDTLLEVGKRLRASHQLSAAAAAPF